MPHSGLISSFASVTFSSIKESNYINLLCLKGLRCNLENREVKTSNLVMFLKFTFANELQECLEKKNQTISLDLSAQNCRFLYMFLQREFGPSH